MPVKKGETWGHPYDGDRRPQIASDDAGLAAVAHSHQGADGPLIASVSSGDLLAGLGYDRPNHGSDPLPSPPGSIAYPMDLGVAEFGTAGGVVELTVPFAAHVLGYRTWPWVPAVLRWPELIVMNGPLVEGRRFGPKAHPNDGLLDITVGSLPLRERREATRRAASGGHLPHPNLTTKRTASHEVDLGHRVSCRVDGVDRGRWRWIRVTVIPDAYTLVAGETSDSEGS